jgi:hypothetical protein
LERPLGHKELEPEVYGRTKKIKPGHDLNLRLLTVSQLLKV